MNTQHAVIVYADNYYLIAQCIEPAISANGKTFSELYKRFKTTIESTIRRNKERSGGPFSGSSSAAQHYADWYREGIELPIDCVVEGHEFLFRLR